MIHASHSNSRNVTLHEGDIVSVFEDPVTGTQFEGEAMLMSQYRSDDGDGLSMWIVKFEDGYRCLRTINAANARPHRE